MKKKTRLIKKEKVPTTLYDIVSVQRKRSHSNFIFYKKKTLYHVIIFLQINLRIESEKLFTKKFGLVKATAIINFVFMIYKKKDFYEKLLLEFLQTKSGDLCYIKVSNLMNYFFEIKLFDSWSNIGVETFA